eukprot:5234538-Pyramimonas_sp.AAC.1
MTGLSKSGGFRRSSCPLQRWSEWLVASVAKRWCCPSTALPLARLGGPLTPHMHYANTRRIWALAATHPMVITSGKYKAEKERDPSEFDQFGRA